MTQWWNFTPAHGGLATLDPLEIKPFIFNPTQVEATAQAVYARRSAIASTYQRLHYQHTSNWSFPLDLHGDTRMMAARNFGQAGALANANGTRIREDFKDYQRFLMALLYPRGQQNDPVRRAPPTVVLSWPGLLYMKVKLMSLRFQWTAFTVDLDPVQFTASCQFEEVRNYRMTHQRMRKQGLMMPTKGSDRVFF